MHWHFMDPSEYVPTLRSELSSGFPSAGTKPYFCLVTFLYCKNGFRSSHPEVISLVWSSVDCVSVKWPDHCFSSFSTWKDSGREPTLQNTQQRTLNNSCSATLLKPINLWVAVELCHKLNVIKTKATGLLLGPEDILPLTQKGFLNLKLNLHRH